MKNNIIIAFLFGLILFFLVTDSLFSQDDFNWSIAAGGQEFDRSYSIYTTDNAHSYLSGSFSGQAEFGDISLQSKGNSDVFLAHFNPYGQCLWAISFGGSSNEYGVSVAVDGKGYIFISGNFNSDTLFFSDNIYLIKNYEQDFFIAKYSPFGDILWAMRFGSTGYDHVV